MNTNFKTSKSTSTLPSDYETACNRLLYRWCEKHEYEFDPRAWVISRVGECATISDWYVDMPVIIDDLQPNVPEDEFVKWYDYCMRAHFAGVIAPNFRAWLNNCPVKTDAELSAIEAKQAEIRELEEEIKKMCGEAQQP